jgi:hypothetical protein
MLLSRGSSGDEANGTPAWMVYGTVCGTKTGAGSGLERGGAHDIAISAMIGSGLSIGLV